MRFIFRSDASRDIGTGHVMRSSAIAEEVIDRGFQAIFIGEIDGIPWLNERINLLGFSEIHDRSSRFKSNPENDVLILDSYSIPTSETFIQEKNWLAVIRIFDKFTPEYKSMLQIHPGIERVTKKISSTKTLYGPMYIPIRKIIKENGRSLKGQKLRITLIGGGSDPKSFVVEIAKIISKMDGDFKVNVMCDPHANIVRDSRFNSIPIGDSLDSLFVETDLVFSTASTTALEFLSAGCCVAIACSMENQLENYEVMSEMGIAHPIGNFSNGSWNLSIEKISEVINNSNLQAKLRNKAISYFDFLGASRIVDSIIQTVSKR